MHTVKDLLRFIEKSPTAFQAVEEIAGVLERYGYTRLEEGEAWSLSAGRGYYVTRNGSSLIAFRLPARMPHSLMLSTVHTDSPTFKLKREHLLAGPDGTVRLSTEPYGGANYSTWLDRPLSVAGRIVISRGDAEAHLARLAVGSHRGILGGDHQIMEQRLHRGFSQTHDVDVAADQHTLGVLP